MKAENFIKLINGITKKDFQIKNNPETIEPENIYIIFRKTPIHNYTVQFKFKAPKNEENLIRSFINNYCNKYLEPNPKAYNGNYGGTKWEDMTEEQKDFAYMHHRSRMKSKTILMDEIKANLEDSSIEDVLLNYAFYHTHYGLGIFVLFAGTYELNVINKMKAFLNENNYIFTNEFSNARWVYRFKLNITKDMHLSILKKFYSQINR